MIADSPMRILLATEELSATPDEGALRTLNRIAAHLDRRHTFLALHERGSSPPDFPSRRVAFTRFGITRALRGAIRDFAPDLVVYAPSAAVTPNALYRGAWLRRAARAPLVVMGFQRRQLGAVGGWISGRFVPDALVVASAEAADDFRARGWPVVQMRLGVDLKRFCPVPGPQREEFRARFGWTDGRPVALHVGHLREGRGLPALEELSRAGACRVVMVASVSESGEEHLADRLAAAGVELHHEYVPDIERFYQAADVYTFPVRGARSAIDFPLSVLEALACGVPVLSTRYGALPEHFDGTGGLRWWEEGEDPVRAIEDLLGRGADPRRLAAPFAWDIVLDRLLEDLDGVLE